MLAYERITILPLYVRTRYPPTTGPVRAGGYTHIIITSCKLQLNLLLGWMKFGVGHRGIVLDASDRHAAMCNLFWYDISKTCGLYK